MNILRKNLETIQEQLATLLDNLFEVQKDQYVMDPKVLEIIRTLLDIRKRLRQE